MKQGRYYGHLNHYESSGFTTRPFRVDNNNGAYLSIESSEIICTGDLATNPKPDYYFYSAINPALGTSLRVNNVHINGLLASSGRLANSDAVKLTNIHSYQYATSTLFASDGANLMLDGSFEASTILDDWIAQGTQGAASQTDRFTDDNCTLDQVSGGRSGKCLRIRKLYGPGSLCTATVFVPIVHKSRVIAAFYYKKPGVVGGDNYISFMYAGGYRLDARGFPSCTRLEYHSNFTVTFPSSATDWTLIGTGEDSIEAPSWATHLAIVINLNNWVAGSSDTDRSLLIDDILVNCI
ncbi:hypothetical protein [Spirosoma aerolatum]|uniref:hypothetical protein n=1 Tax=Spirosoma aerolatum TaxID=1211326 RepID=UPI0009AD8ED4|nr:hypothetical protein [Spirosoma aerolatum]